MFDVMKFSYNPETGSILKLGKKCGGISNKGYLLIQDGGKRIMAHRLAWFLFYNKWPSCFLDHINGNKTDNRISNLRESSARLNGINKNIHRDGRLPGYTVQPNGKYKAQIYFNKKKYSLGNYATEQEAHEMYINALNKVLAGKSPVGAEPAKDDGKPEVGDVVAFCWNCEVKEIVSYTESLASRPVHSMCDCVILMRAAEVKRRIEGGE